jgi:PPR repeat family/Pentatricopeptide repeat domain
MNVGGQQDTVHNTMSTPPSPTLFAQQQKIDFYNRKIQALATTVMSNHDRRAGEKAERWLREMMEEQGLPPNALAYTNTIVAWSRSRHPDAAPRAQALLDELKELYQSNTKQTAHLQPSKVPYTAVITAWAKNRHQTAGIKVLNLLQEMKIANNSFCSPNAITYGACISAVNGTMALKLLDEVTKRYEEGDLTCRPDTVVYSSTIAALAKRQGSYARANELLLHMEKMFDNGDDFMKPNAFSYSSAITSCWDRKIPPKECLQRAESILTRMTQRFERGLSDVRPTVVVYNSFLHVCSNCESQEAGDKAMELFCQMPCTPDSVTYCTLMTAISRSGNPSCGKIALELLDDMRQRCNLKPNTFVYGAAIAAQAKCGDAETAERLLSVDMVRDKCLPNTICYNSLIAASNDASRACRLMQDMYRRGDRFVKPNTVTYNTVLGAMASSSAPPKTAQALFEDMQRRTAAGEIGVKPNHVTYSTLVAIWTETGRGLEARQRVEKLLDEMSDL